jgi:hypothetical protein
MAIELTKERRVGPPLWMIFASLGVAIVLVFLIMSYLFLFFVNKSTVKKTEDLEASMIGLNKNIRDKESELTLIQKKVNDYNKLISNHKNLENVFKFIEKKVMPSIWFSKFDFNSIADNTVTLEGIGPNFVAINQQVDMLKKDELVREISIGDIAINKDGEIDFTLKIKFAPEIFSYEKEI